MRGGPQPLEGDEMDAPTLGWWKAKDGSWHPHRLIEVRCPRCGLEGGAPVGSSLTSCPSCGTTFEVADVTPDPAPAVIPPPPAAPASASPASAPEPPPVPVQADPPPRPPRPDGATTKRRSGGWASTIVLVAIAFVVVIVGAVNGRPDPVPALATMHFCTSGSAPTVNLKMTIGASGATSLTNVANGHCAVNEKFVTGSTLKVAVWNSTGVGEVACTIVRNGHRISTDRSALREEPATCSGRA